MKYDTRAIRKFIMYSFNDDELGFLCSDYFQEVYINFTHGMTKEYKAQMLIDHCRQSNQIPKLLNALEEKYPRGFQKKNFIKSKRPPTQNKNRRKQAMTPHIQETVSNSTTFGWRYEIRVIISAFLILLSNLIFFDIGWSEISSNLLVMLLIVFAGLMVLRFVWWIDSISRVNINDSQVDKLINHAKIAPTYAQLIVDYRINNGNFSTLEQAKLIPRISPKTRALLESKGKIQSFVPYSYSKYLKLLIDLLLRDLLSK